MAYKINRDDEYIVIPDGVTSARQVRKLMKQQKTPEFYELEAAEVLECLLDDDDIWLEEKLEVQVNALENSNEKFSSTEGYFGEGVYSPSINYKRYNSEHFLKILKKKYKKTDFLKKGVFPEIWDFAFLNIHNCIIKSSVMIEKELFQEVGGIRGLPEKADYDCWLSLLKLTNCLYINEPLFYYDGLHGDGRKYN